MHGQVEYDSIECHALDIANKISSQNEAKTVFEAVKRGHKEVVQYLMEKKGGSTMLSDDVSLIACLSHSPTLSLYDTYTGL